MNNKTKEGHLSAAFFPKPGYTSSNILVKYWGSREIIAGI